MKICLQDRELIQLVLRQEGRRTADALLSRSAGYARVGFERVSWAFAGGWPLGFIHRSLMGSG